MAATCRPTARPPTIPLEYCLITPVLPFPWKPLRFVGAVPTEGVGSY